MRILLGEKMINKIYLKTSNEEKVIEVTQIRDEVFQVIDVYLDLIEGYVNENTSMTNTLRSKYMKEARGLAKENNLRLKEIKKMYMGKGI